jgi:hypothetical protein
MTEMDQRIPDLSDKELESLHANALRLAASGSDKQRQQAESLLPLIAEQMETRRAAKTKTQAADKEAAKQRRAEARESAKKNLAE